MLRKKLVVSKEEPKTLVETLVETVPEPVNEEEIRRQVIDAIIHEQLNKSLYKTAAIHNCGSCDIQTDNVAVVCRPCQLGGHQADLNNQLGRRMGWSTGVPVNLLEVLQGITTQNFQAGHTDEQLLSMDQDELASLFDKNNKVETPSVLVHRQFV